MKRCTKYSIAAFLAGVTLLSPDAARACAVCMGASDSTVAPAANGAIFFMIGLVGFMMASGLGLIFYLARRARHPNPAHEELAEALKIISEDKQHA